MDSEKEAPQEHIVKIETPKNLEVDSIRVTVVFKKTKAKQGTGKPKK